MQNTNLESVRAAVQAALASARTAEEFHSRKIREEQDRLQREAERVLRLQREEEERERQLRLQKEATERKEAARKARAEEVLSPYREEVSHWETRSKEAREILVALEKREEELISPLLNEDEEISRNLRELSGSHEELNRLREELEGLGLSTAPLVEALEGVERLSGTLTDRAAVALPEEIRAAREILEGEFPSRTYGKKGRVSHRGWVAITRAREARAREALEAAEASVAAGVAPTASVHRARADHRVRIVRGAVRVERISTRPTHTHTPTREERVEEVRRNQRISGGPGQEFRPGIDNVSRKSRARKEAEAAKAAGKKGKKGRK